MTGEEAYWAGLGPEDYDRPTYCAACGLPVRTEAAMQLRNGDLTHQGACYEQASQEAANAKNTES